jgi:hypothetical protein
LGVASAQFAHTNLSSNKKTQTVAIQCALGSRRWPAVAILARSTVRTWPCAGAGNTFSDALTVLANLATGAIHASKAGSRNRDAVVVVAANKITKTIHVELAEYRRGQAYSVLASTSLLTVEVITAKLRYALGIGTHLTRDYTVDVNYTWQSSCNTLTDEAELPKSAVTTSDTVGRHVDTDIVVAADLASSAVGVRRTNSDFGALSVLAGQPLATVIRAIAKSRARNTQEPSADLTVLAILLGQTGG